MYFEVKIQKFSALSRTNQNAVALDQNTVNFDRLDSHS